MQEQIMRAYVSSMLSNYEIIVNIDDSAMNDKIKINVLNVDGTNSTTEVTVHDALYLTEYGTLTIPPRKIFRRMYIWLRDHRQDLIDSITDGILNSEWNENDIVGELERFIVTANSQLDVIITSVQSEENYVSKLTNSNSTVQYIANLWELRKYIKCKYVKKS